MSVFGTYDKNALLDRLLAHRTLNGKVYPAKGAGGPRSPLRAESKQIPIRAPKNEDRSPYQPEEVFDPHIQDLADRIVAAMAKEPGLSKCVLKMLQEKIR